MSARTLPSDQFLIIQLQVSHSGNDKGDKLLELDTTEFLSLFYINVKNWVRVGRKEQLNNGNKHTSLRKYNSVEEAFLTFIEYSKAVDSVKHHRLPDFIMTMGFPKHLVALIACLYHNQKATIRWNGEH